MGQKTETIQASLFTDNLIPIYLLQQKLKANFVSIQKRLDQNQKNIRAQSSRSIGQQNQLNTIIQQMQQTLKKLPQQVEQYVQERTLSKMNLAISNKVKQYLESTVTQKSSQSVNPREVEKIVSSKISDLKSSLKMDLINEAETSIENKIRQTKRALKILKINTADLVDPSKQLQLKMEDCFEAVKEMQNKTARMWELMQINEKTIYEHNTHFEDKFSLITEELESRRQFDTRVMEELRGQIADIKSDKGSFENVNMDAVDQAFKNKINDNIKELNTNIVRMLSKTEFQMLYYLPLKSKLDICFDEVLATKHEIVKVNQAIAYSNNLQRQIEQQEERFQKRIQLAEATINNTIKKLENRFDDQNSKNGDKFAEFYSENYHIRAMIQGLDTRLQTAEVETVKVPGIIEQLQRYLTRLAYLQNLNNVDQHMEDIHSLLDKPFLQQNKNKKVSKIPDSNYDEKIDELKQVVRDSGDVLKGSVEELKMMTAKKGDIHELWKALNIMETRLEMVKNGEEKRWNCASCEKGFDNTGKVNKNIDGLVNKKLDTVKFGGFGQKQSSSKNIKGLTSGQIRDARILSESLKLPDIMQEKSDTSRELREMFK